MNPFGKPIHITVSPMGEQEFSVLGDDRCPEGRFYMVSGDSVVECDLTTGDVRTLEGSDRERVLRWILRK